MDTIKKTTYMETFEQDVQKGLSSKPKRLSSKYFYDERGDKLFRQIMTLPEYYLTSCEAEILTIYKEEFLRICCENVPFKLVDLGAGDGSKTEILMRYFLNKKIDFEYVPIDISENAINTLLDKMRTKYPDLRANGRRAEYSEGLKELQQYDERKMVLFLGSNLGNFDYRDAVSFLKKLYDNLNKGDHLLLGLDLKKDPDIILSAYNDAKGVTASFNLNLLERINKELGADFDLSNFKHHATYDPISGEVKSFLISMDKQKVHINALEKSFSFEKWEPIFTECSNKYDVESITKMAEASGFTIVKSFSDSCSYFIDTLWVK